MTKKIPGVPESISRADYIKLIEASGIDPAQMLELNFKADGIYATVFALNDEGRRTLDRSSDGLNKHIVYIPVED